jgi:FkbM family methyltransferase
MLHFLDVGANEGQTFDCYLSSHPEYDGCHVWCIEPSPRVMLPLLQKAYQLREKYQIHVCPFGLRAFSGLVPFYMMATGSPADSFEVTVGPVMQCGYSIDTYAVGLREFLRYVLKPHDTAVLKLDCEGSEYELLTCLLDSTSLSYVTKIMVEFHQVKLISSMPGEEELKRQFAEHGKALENWPY